MNDLHAAMLLCSKLNDLEINAMRNAMMPASDITVDLVEGDDYKIDPFEISWPLVAVSILSIATSAIAIGSFIWLCCK